MACNKIPLIPKVNFEYAVYTTDKAIDLFFIQGKKKKWKFEIMRLPEIESHKKSPSLKGF